MSPSAEPDPGSERASGGEDSSPPGARRRPARKSVLLRLDPAIHDALARWAADDLRSVNAQIDMLLRRALKDAGRLPKHAPAPRRPGRPPADPDRPAAAD